MKLTIRSKITYFDLLLISGRLKKGLGWLALAALMIPCLLIESARAQQASMQGIISDHAGGQPLDGANIVLRGITNEDVFRGAATDRNGFYHIGRIEPGSYALRASYIGYLAHEDTLVFSAGESKTVSISLRKDDALLDEVIVSFEGGAARREEGRQRVTPVDLRRVPTPAGGGDLVSYLQALPGVVAVGDRGGQIFIRGGTPAENMVLVDGALIYQPFHIVGFFSPFPENLISSADFYAGGFGPRYNGRISSVLDVRMRHGDRFQTRGSASVSPFLADVLVEGPIVEGQSSWIVSVRRSLIEQTSPWFLSERQPLRFESQFVKGSFIETDTRCSAMLMRTYDRGRLDFESDDSIKWNNFILGGRCVALPEGSSTLLDTNINISHLSNVTDNNDDLQFFSRITRFSMDMNLTQYTGKVRFDYGAFIRTKFLNFDMREKFQGIEGDNYTLFNIGSHLQVSIPVGNNIQLRPGVAFSLYPGDYTPSVEPRFRASWQPFGREEEELSGMIGIYRQPVVGVSDMRDASSVFVAWMRAPIGGSQMEAVHAMLSWQQTLGAGFHWSMEGYHKRLSNLPVTVWSTIARFTTDLSLADGKVYGGDIRLEYNRGPLYGLIGYGYTRTMYEAAQDHFGIWFGEPVQRYHPPHERRHQINTMLTLTLGQYTAGARWQFGTGLPFTRPIGFDEILRFDEGLPDVRRNLGIRRVILEKPYQGRLPLYHRLDVSLERTFDFPGSGPSVNVQAGAVNLYDQTNLFYYDVFTHRRLDQLPLVPYFSLKVES